METHRTAADASFAEVITPDDFPLVGLTKASAQAAPETGAALPWAEPRLAFDDLLYFFDTNVWHRRCVLARALLVGGLGWRVERGGDVLFDAGRGIDRAPAHPLVALLRRPHPGGSFDEIVHRLLVDHYAVGNGFLEVVRDRAGRVAELYHIPARTMRADAAGAGYWQTTGAARVAFDAFGAAAGRPEVLHLYQYDPLSPRYGMPDWLAALGAMGLDRTILEFNTRLFANSLMAHLAVVVEGGRLSPGGREALRAFVRDHGTGVANAGRVLLLEDERTQVKIRFERLNLEVKDLLIVEAQRHFRDVVIGAHGVPPRVLGIVTAGQLGATGEVEGQLRTFRETVLRPGRRLLEAALAPLVAVVDPACRLSFAEMDVTDLRADADFFGRMIDQGVLTPAEVRARVAERGA